MYCKRLYRGSLRNIWVYRKRNTNTYNNNINSIDDQHYTLITLRVRLKEKENAINNLTNIVYDCFCSNMNEIEYAIIDEGFSQETADAIMPLLKLYLTYL